MWGDGGRKAAVVFGQVGPAEGCWLGCFVWLLIGRSGHPRTPDCVAENGRLVSVKHLDLFDCIEMLCNNLTALQ